MGIFNWLWPSSNFKRFADSFAVNQDAIWPKLKDVVLSDQNRSKTIWLVAHFPSRFQEIQDRLELWNVDYEVATVPVEVERLFDSSLMTTESVKIVLASLIPELQQLPDSINHQQSQLAMIVVDRHPVVQHDQRLVSFAQFCPCQTELGYYLALDDPIVKLVVNETTIQLLEQMGLGQNDLISSTMVSNRIKKVLTRQSRSYRGDGPADSPEEWLEQYGSES